MIAKTLGTKGAIFLMLSQKRNTTTVQQKSLRVREREKEIQKIDLQAIREGNEIRTGAAALLCCYSFPCISTQAQTHTHTQSFSEFQLPVIMLKSGGEAPLPSSLRRQMCCARRLHKAQRFHTVEMGGEVSQAHFVTRGEAPEHIVAFCQQVKIRC